MSSRGRPSALRSPADATRRKVDMSPEAVSARLRAMSRASDLRHENRLAAKVDMSSAAVSRRLRRQSQLRDVCLAWQRIGEANGLGKARR